MDNEMREIRMANFAHTPDPPYYAVVFTSMRTESDNGYAAVAKKWWSSQGSNRTFWVSRVFGTKAASGSRCHSGLRRRPSVCRKSTLAISWPSVFNGMPRFPASR